MTDVSGWVGKILRVDLTEAKTSEEETVKYADRFIGGRGINAKIAWDEISPETGPFDPENRLIIMTGPLTGTLAPSSGRLTVGGVAPQRYPKGRYSRSGMGGRWPSELKYAGYDGIIVQGKAEKPSYLWVHNGEVEIKDASKLWGLDIFSTVRKLMDQYGDEVKVACIGPAGERLVRIAIIQNDSESAAGQGGFGAVMGSKNLKAIAVRGTTGVSIARPKEFLNLCLAIDRLHLSPMKLSPRETSANPSEHVQACSLACKSYCAGRYRKNVPGVEYPGLNSSECFCFGFAAPSFEVSFEARVLAGKYGLNAFEVGHGIAAWLAMCREKGLIADIDGEPIPSIDYRDGVPNRGHFIKPSAQFWVTLLRRIAYREGIGNLLAEGTCRAADRCFEGRGKQFLLRIYPGAPEAPLGQVGHWDGHYGWGPPFPHWLVSALIWTFDTRDPGSDTLHAFTNRVTSWAKEYSGILTRSQMADVAKRVYGSEGAYDPSVSYDPPSAKVRPAIWHTDRGCVVSSLVVCEQFFPKIFSLSTESYYGDTSLESKLLSAATGIDFPEALLDEAGERILNLERAIEVRYGRTRGDDERMIPFFEQPDSNGVKLNRAKFLRLMGEYYRLRGWDIRTGRPTRTKLEELGLMEVAEGLERLRLLP